MNFYIFRFVVIFLPVFLENNLTNAQDTYQDETTEFCYNDAKCAPNTWPGICQSGKSQSPINVPYNFLYHHIGKRVDLRLNSQYLQRQRFILANDGHTVQLSLKNDLTSTSTLEGTLLGGKYIFSQVHFHWGSNKRHGAEHTINSFVRYPMEAHLVHYSAKYNNFTEALNSEVKGAIAVIAVFFQRIHFDNPALSPIINAMENIRAAKSKTTGSSIRLKDFLVQSSSRSKNVIQYYGSLTIPNCNEGVLWNLIMHPIQISNRQLSAFHTEVLDTYGRRLVTNNRPLQNSNGREIKHLRSSIWH